MVHVNLVDKIFDKNDCFVAGAVTRFKFTKRQAITVEYGLRLNKYSKEKYYDSFGIGYDLETGGHVFQIHLTNSFGLTEDQYFMYTNTSWDNWGIRLGFNISRVFSLQGKNKEAYSLHYKLMDVISMIFSENNPAGIKAVLHCLGIASNEVRLPLVKASEKLQKEITNFVINLD